MKRVKTKTGKDVNNRYKLEVTKYFIKQVYYYEDIKKAIQSMSIHRSSKEFLHTQSYVQKDGFSLLTDGGPHSIKSFKTNIMAFKPRCRTYQI